MLRPIQRYLFFSRVTSSHKVLNEREDVCARPLGHLLEVPFQSCERLVRRVLPVEELPQVDARRAQPEPATGIGIEENGPVVKLLPEHDVGFRTGLSSLLTVLFSLLCSVQ